MDVLNNFLDFTILRVGEHSLQVYTIISLVITLVVTRFIIWLIKKALYSKNKLKPFDEGNSYALFQIISYVIWIIAFAIIL